MGRFGCGDRSGYIAAALARGLLSASHLGTLNLIWIIAAVAGLCAVSSFWLTPPVSHRQVPSADHDAHGLAALTRAFLTLALAGTALIQGSHSAYYTFSAISWQAAGMSSTTVALLWALCVVVEIALFAASPRLGLSPTALLSLGGVGAVLRWIITTQEPGLAVLSFAQALHALSFGADASRRDGTRWPVSPPAASWRTRKAMSRPQAASSGLGHRHCSAGCTASLGQSIYYGMAAMALAGTIVIVASRHSIRSDGDHLAPQRRCWRMHQDCRRGESLLRGPRRATRRRDRPSAPAARRSSPAPSTAMSQPCSRP